MVDHNILFEKMRQININEKIIQGVKLMFNNLKIQAPKENMAIGRGLGQGWSVSCLLFNIFTNDLTE